MPDDLLELAATRGGAVRAGHGGPLRGADLGQARRQGAGPRRRHGRGLGRRRLRRAGGGRARPSMRCATASRGSSACTARAAASPAAPKASSSYPMTCHSGGTLEIYVEPFLPKPLLVLRRPRARGRDARHARPAAGYSVVTLPVDAAGRGSRRSGSGRAPRWSWPPTRLRRGRAGAGAQHRGRLCQPRRQPQAGRGGPRAPPAARRAVRAARARFKAPAGLDLGAVTPAEIAVSILAEIVQHHRGDEAAEAIAGAGPGRATEATIRSAACRSRSPPRATARRWEAAPSYFCCRRCKETFEQNPERYPVRPP